ncbi:MAG: hypothetical protein ACWA5W_03605 [Phycisphaerales bacterium]
MSLFVLGGAMAEAGSVHVVPVALPAKVPAIYRSDHANYWMIGVPAVMVTDTSEYRTPRYHRMSVVAETLDIERMGVGCGWGGAGGVGFGEWRVM